MRRRNLPPVGALTTVAQLKQPDRLYLVSPSLGDAGFVDLRVPEAGISLFGYGAMETIRGLEVWNRDIWEAAEFRVYGLNLLSEQNKKPNNHNDAYLFRKLELADRFAEWCTNNPDPKFIDMPDGHRIRTSPMPFLSVRTGQKKAPSA